MKCQMQIVYLINFLVIPLVLSCLDPLRLIEKTQYSVPKTLFFFQSLVRLLKGM